MWAVCVRMRVCACVTVCMRADASVCVCACVCTCVCANVYNLTHSYSAMFRLTALWFNNSTNRGINGLLRTHIGKIPTRKYLPLIYQIASRLGAPSGAENGWVDLSTHTLSFSLTLATAPTITDILDTFTLHNCTHNDKQTLTCSRL